MQLKNKKVSSSCFQLRIILLEASIGSLLVAQMANCGEVCLLDLRKTVELVQEKQMPEQVVQRHENSTIKKKVFVTNVCCAGL